MSVSTVTVDGYCAIGVDREYDQTEEVLLGAMDRACVERAVVAPTDRHLAVLNAEGNDVVLDAARRHHDRLIPSCTANPWFGQAARHEVHRRAEQGARILIIHPYVQGYLANDELVWPLLEAATEERLPVYVHTGPPGNATPWQVVDLAERFPDTDFIIGHCGATDFWNDMPFAASAAANVYFESSLARPFQFARYVKSVGTDRGIVGSFAPISDLEFEWAQMRDMLSPSDYADVYGPNLLRLLGKREAR